MPLFLSGCQVIGSIACLALISNWGGGTTKRYDTPFVARLKSLVNNAQKYYDLASGKRTPKHVRLSHLSMALAFATAAKTLASNDDIENVTDLKMETFIHTLQLKHTKALKALG